MPAPDLSPAAGGIELYIYYRARSADEATVLATLTALHDRLRTAHPGLETSLLRRTGPNDDGLHTWMEIYRHPTAPVAEAAIEAAAAAVTAPWRVGDRHVERFACAWSR